MQASASRWRLWLRYLWFAVLCLAISIAMIDLCARLLFELRGAFNVDDYVYWGVGRGILNGFKPYTDLFDIKPPGIFLLSAASLWLNGNAMLMHVAQAIVIVGIPCTLMIPVWLETSSMRRFRRYELTALAFLGGSALTLYTAHRSGALQTESFGAFFGCAYLAAIATSAPRLSRTRFVAATLALLLAIGFKEPFVLTCAVGALFIRQDWTWIRERILVPYICAALAGIAIVAALGLFQGYFGMYLPFMLGTHIERWGHPLLLRALEVHRIFIDLAAYSPAFLAFILFLFLSLLSVIAQPRRPMQWLWFALLLALLLAVPYVALTWFPINLLAVSGTMLYTWPRFALMVAPLIVLLLVACQQLGRGESTDDGTSRFVALILFLAAGYMSSLSVAAGGEFFPHHFAFAVPAYLGLVLGFLAQLKTHSYTRWWRWMACVPIIALLYVTAFHTREDYRSALLTMRSELAQAQQGANLIDTTMDRCGIERYMYIGEVGVLVYGLTRHSPLGPGFFQYSLNVTYPQFGESFVHNLQTNANILILPPQGAKTRPFTEDVVRFIGDHFSTDPWPCAQPYDAPKDFRIFFRKS